MESLLQTGRPVRVLLTCVAALLAVNAVVLTSQLDADTARASDAVVEEAPPGTVLLVGADGVTISIDPSTKAGRTAIAEAEARGDTIVTAPPGAEDAGASEPGAIGATGARPGPVPGARSVSELDAADGLVDGIVHVVDDATGKVVARTVAQLDGDGNGTVDGPSATTSTAPGPAADEPLLEITIPPVSVTIPGVAVSTPPVSVTTPPVSVTTPPVTVSTPVTTVTVPTTTVTVPPTTVTVPTTTVTVPPTTITVPTTTVTVTVPTTTLTTLLGI